MVPNLFASVADALITYAIERLDFTKSPKSWPKQNPARVASQKVLAWTYSAFAHQCPEYTPSPFDQFFLTREALPQLSKMLIHDQHPEPVLLANAWGQSAGVDAKCSQSSTKPTAYFLERLQRELKAEVVLQSIFDARALESLPKGEVEIQKLTADLQRELDATLNTASKYPKVTLQIEGDVQYTNIIIGNNNITNQYYYSGNFVSLNEYYIP